MPHNKTLYRFNLFRATITVGQSHQVVKVTWRMTQVKDRITSFIISMNTISGGGAVIDTADPLSPPPASPSVQGHFTHAAVAVDSTPCSAIGK